jgi:hypothetical protein
MKTSLNRISRRRLLHGAGSTTGAGLFGLAGGQTAAKRPQALALIGDRYHNADYIRVNLDRVFKAVVKRSTPCGKLLFARENDGRFRPYSGRQHP